MFNVVGITTLFVKGIIPATTRQQSDWLTLSTGSHRSLASLLQSALSLLSAGHHARRHAWHSRHRMVTVGGKGVAVATLFPTWHTGQPNIANSHKGQHNMGSCNTTWAA